MQRRVLLLVRRVLTAISAAIVFRLLYPISDQIVQRISADQGWDARISAGLKSLMTSVEAISFPSWLLLALAASIGATLTAWLLPWLTRVLVVWERRKCRPDPILFRHVKAFHTSYMSEAASLGIQTLQFLTREVGKNAGMSQWAGLLQRAVVDKGQATWLVFEKALKEQISLDELQDRLGEFIREYQAIRTYIVISAEAVQSRLPAGGFFDNWRRSDERLLQELRRLCGLPEFERLSRHVTAIGWGEDVTRLLDRLSTRSPLPPHTAPTNLPVSTPPSPTPPR